MSEKEVLATLLSAKNSAMSATCVYTVCMWVFVGGGGHVLNLLTITYLVTITADRVVPLAAI